MADIKTPYKTVLSIAGSDSGGCAGIQADIKSISACGAYAATVVTATTAQNTQGVIDIHAIPVEHLEKQLEAVFSDIQFNAVKIGMLHSCEVIGVVANALDVYQPSNIIIDPVMVATSGDRLITDEAIDCLKKLLPQATLITPNKREAELLTDREVQKDNIEVITKDIGEYYGTSVLLKAGCLGTSNDWMSDVFFDHVKKNITIIKNSHIETLNTHGTGCSLSSSVAAFLSNGYSLNDSVIKGCSYVNSSIKKGRDKVLGKGHGPINHFGL